MKDMLHTIECVALGYFVGVPIMVFLSTVLPVALVAATFYVVGAAFALWERVSPVKPPPDAHT